MLNGNVNWLSWSILACMYFVGFHAVLAQAQARDPLTLWYDHPAKSGMTEAMVVGNGRLGGMVSGDPASERIVLNEVSLWTGGANPSGDYSNDFGAYQKLGELRIDLPGHDAAKNYRRDLDISQALAHVSYDSSNVKYRREIFVSHPANVLVVRLTADKPGSYTGGIGLTDSHKASTSANDNRLTVAGELPNGLKYETQCQALTQGGSAKARDGKIDFEKCDSITLLLSARTNYVMDFARQYRGDAPHARISADLESAAKKSFDDLRAEHVSDYQSLFNRVTLNVGESTSEQRAQPTDVRKRGAATAVDPELEALLFQLGRYFMISSSRPGSLPANLQGIWNESNSPPWHCDYHSNINIEMNYWPAEVANLSECHTPLFDLMASQLPAWRKATATAKEFKTQAGEMTQRGFAIRTSHNIFGGMGWKWDNTANAWYCQHLWEHFAFGRDKKYLSEVAYPIMKETVQFWQDHLKALPDGRLVVPNAWSPEHGPTEDGVCYSQEIVWDLFTNYIEACDVLGIDRAYRDEVETMRGKLATPGAGSWGQLLEWMTEKKGVDAKTPELDTPDDHHRHTSHLFAVFPGRQISMEKTPALAEAAKVSLAARGDDGDVREWSFAWRTALWARFGGGERAHGQLMNLLADRNTCPNLFGLHPPMQIDGNFGITAAMVEMLLQSQTGTLQLLPALPKAWSSGSVTGLCARGGFQLDLTWKNGALQQTTVRSTQGDECKVKYGTIEASLKTSPGGVYVLNGALQGK